MNKNEKIQGDSLNIEENYGNSQRLDNDLSRSIEIGKELESVGSIDFDKVKSFSSNEMIGFDNVPQVDTSLPAQNVNTFYNSQQMTQNFIAQPNVQMNGMVVPTIETAPIPKKNKKSIIGIIVGLLILLGFVGGFILLKQMGIIMKEPTIAEIYHSYDYNYTTNDIKLNFDGKSDIYLIKNVDELKFVSKNNENYFISILDNVSLNSIEDMYSIVETTKDTSDNSDDLVVNYNDFNGNIGTTKYTILSKEIMWNNQTIVVYFQYDNNISDEDLSTMKEIYKTIIFKDF